MKLTGFLMLIASLQVSARGYTQTVTLSMKDAPLEKVFDEINKQTGYSFVYTTDVTEKTKSITINLKNASVDEAMTQCLSGLPYNFVIRDSTIVIRPKITKGETNPVQEISKDNPPIDVKGRVSNEMGEPLVGANVKVRGTNKMASTNANGEFTLAGVDENGTLEISFVGYETQIITVKGKASLIVLLDRKISPLDETVVIGYGVTTQRFNVGSVTKVTKNDIAEQPVSNPLAALQGRVPGLIVNATSGLPGATFNVQIRGQNSLNPIPGAITPLDQPLFIIDGVPFATQNSKINQLASLASPNTAPTIYNNSYGGISPFNMINPSDLESIEVLRDADATAIYGSRGANGVILITTKKGKAGKTKVSINLYSGISKVTRTMSLMNTDQYREMRRQAFSNDGIIPNTTVGTSGYAPDLLIFDSSKYTDWKKYLLGGNARTTDLNTFLSGGSNNTQFLVGAGFHHETYIFPGDFGEYRASFNFNLNHYSFDKRFSMDFSLNSSYEKNNSSSSAKVFQAFTLPPNYPDLKDAADNLNWNYKGYQLNDNPLGYLKQNYLSNNFNLISHLQIAYELVKGLVLRTSLGYNSLIGNENSQIPKSSLNPATNPLSSSSFGTNSFQTWIIEPQLQYSKMINKSHLDLLIGGTYQKNINTSARIDGNNYSNDALLGSVSAAGTTVSSDAYSQYRYIGVFGRLNYQLNKKYILNFTGRRDGSSRFGPGRQFGNFGSVGAGWLFLEEKFLKIFSPIVSYGKIRGSFGSTGNDNIGNYKYLSAWTVNNNLSYQGTAGYFPQNLYNPDFSWSVTKKLEAGIELGLLKDRIFISTTWFRNKSDNQLVTYKLPSQTGGFDGVTANFPAVVQNIGWEFQLSTINIQNKNFLWKTNFNLTIPQNKLLEFPQIESSSYFSTYVVGQSLNVLNRFRLASINPLTGIYEFNTKSGNVSNNPQKQVDYFIIGDLDPEFYGGLNNSFKFKNLQLGVFLEFKKQIGPNYLSQIYSNTTPGFYGNLPTTFLRRWQKPGDILDIQKLTSQSNSIGNAGRNFAISNAAYTDASYIRFKTISLSYTWNKD